jgi:hypothetical protein
MLSNYHTLKCTLLWIVLLGAGSLSAQTDTTRILFIGNSFTYYYNLPQVLHTMAASQGTVLLTRQSTVGGSGLELHWKGEKDSKARQLLEEQSWDYVVLNNHSLATIDDPEGFADYSKKFVDLIREKGATPIMMMTWAYRSNPLMQQTISAAYRRFCTDNQVQLVPAGEIFAEARQNRPDLILFADDKHPSHNGTYLLGLTFYKFFSDQAVTGISPRIITTDRDGEKLYLLITLPEDAAFMQQLVDQTAFKTAH